jgi:hypothetical protein
VVINDFYIVRVAIAPGEADAPPIVDANTVLTRPVARQPLQAVSRRDSQILDCLCGMDKDQLPVGSPLQVRGQAPGAFSAEDTFGFGVGETAYHYP